MSTCDGTSCGLACLPSYKPCFGNCVGVNDPDFGCTANVCSACPALPNTLTVGCANGQCVPTGCATGYSDVDGVASNGCETLNPKSVKPSNLALWLEGDVGVFPDVTGVFQWNDQSGRGNDAVQSMATLRPQQALNLWPARANMPTIQFQGTQSLTVNLTALANPLGFTLLVAVARYGNTDNNMVLRAGGTALACCAAGAQALEIGWLMSSVFTLNPWCYPISSAVPPNGTTSFQALQATSFWDPGTYYQLDFGGSVLNTSMGFGCGNQGPTNMTGGTLGLGFSGNFNGLIAEVILYDAVLSGSERATVEAYLKAKWKTP
jgi:hypothetical protein